MLLSLIIPMYNAAGTICRCLDSIGQHDDMEIVLVDDGSTDNTYEICREYAQGKSNYKILRQTNGGPQAAINNALSCVQGTYVGFVDSDDTVSPEFYQVLSPHLREGVQDIIAFSYLRIDGQGNITENRIIAQGDYTGEALLDLKKQYLVNGTMQFSRLMDPGRWNKVYKNSLLQGQKCHFDESYRLGEDILMTTACVLASESILCLDGAFLYHYIDTPNSLSKYVYEEYWQKYCDLICRIKALYEMHNILTEHLDGMYVYFGKAIIKKMAHKLSHKEFLVKACVLLEHDGFKKGLKTVEGRKIGMKEKIFCALLKQKARRVIYMMLKHRA